MSTHGNDVRVLLAQAAAFARRENLIDAVARARLALAAAGEDAAAAALAQQAVDDYEQAFEVWNRNVEQRRQLRIDNAARDERAELPGSSR